MKEIPLLFTIIPNLCAQKSQELHVGGIGPWLLNHKTGRAN